MPTHEQRRRPVSPCVLALLMWALCATPAALLAQESSPEVAGPDVTVIYLSGTSNWGSSGGVRAYSVGTTSCNIGGAPVAWCDAGTCLGGTLQSNDHPVIAQNMYRLKDNRFSQIGMSWLKHGWLSTNSFDGACGSCVSPPGGGDQLGVGCTDTYGSGLNGGSGNPGTCLGGGSCRLGQRSEVNATTGDFPMPYTNIPHPSAIDQRIQVAETDLDPALNAGANYWIEGQYIAGDDGLAGNAFNNASYRTLTVAASSPYNLTLTGSTEREKSAVHGWKVVDPTVEIFNSDFCIAPVERFEVARKVTVVDGDTWHYEYAVRNMNSDHGAGAFSVDLPDATPIANVGFRDIDHHSGEPYSTTDWTPNVNAATGTVSWATESFAANNNANALRFATMFNFWFDADAAPETAAHAIDTFKPLVVAEAGPGTTICAGETANLGTPAVAGQTYLWTPGGATSAQINVSPVTTTEYTLTATSSCASADDTVTVTVVPVPEAPLLVTPVDGSTGLQPPVTLSWNAVTGAADYTVELATDAGFTQIVQSPTVAGTTLNLSSLAGTTYYWRVTANATCSGAPSAAFDFTVDAGIFSDGFESNDTTAWSLAFP